MKQYIPKSVVLTEIKRRIERCAKQREDMLNVQCHTLADDASARMGELNCFQDFLDTIEVLEVGVDFGDPKGDKSAKYIIDTKTLEVKEVGVWKTVDNINHPQADKNKIYCVFIKDRHILATVINHPKDEELLQWKCTEFPHHRYAMCEGDKYMQIV